MPSPRFGLPALFFFTSACCAVAASVHWFGVAAVVLTTIIVISILVVLLVWTLACIQAPEATKYGTVCLILGACTLSLLPCWTLRSRERARRNEYIHRLQQIGRKYSEFEQFHVTFDEREYWHLALPPFGTDSSWDSEETTVNEP